MPRSAGRSVFGDDPAGYAAGRPRYPDAVFDWIGDRIGLAQARMFEVGAGTGSATRTLLDRGVAALHAIEPDARLAGWLARSIADPRLTIEVAPFEDARLGMRHDVGVAATAFHWVDPQAGMARARRLLAPGGAFAMWWTMHMRREGAFDRAVDALFHGLETPPTHGTGRPVPYGLDRAARHGELTAAGFSGVEHECFDRTHRFDADALVALYATFSQVRRLPPDAATRFLEHLRAIVDRQGGVVERIVRTPVYLARSP